MYAGFITIFPVWCVLLWFGTDQFYPYPWIILGMGLANERLRYNATSSPIGQAHTQTDPWYYAIALSVEQPRGTLVNDLHNVAKYK